MAVLTASYTGHLSTQFVYLLTMMAGLIELLFAVLNLGFIVEYISVPVISGFVSAVTLIITVSQLKLILGITVKTKSFLQNLKAIAQNIINVRLSGDLVLGVICIIVLLFLRKLRDIKLKQREKPGKLDDSKSQRMVQIVNKLFWFISTGRNALVVVFSMALTAFYKNHLGTVPFALTGSMEPGLPPFRLPPMNTTVGNSTYTFVEMVQEIGPGIIIVPLIALLENIAIAKAFSKGQSVEARQEMIALGFSNLIGSCFGGMPTCGALTRSAVSNASGVKSPLSSLFSGVLVLLSVSFLTPYFHLIPRATLSAVLICAVVFLIEWELLIEMWKIKRFDFLITLVTFIVCVSKSVEVGLLCGVGISALQLVYLWQKPNIAFKIYPAGAEHHYIMVTPDRGLYYPAVSYIRDKMLDRTEKEKNTYQTNNCVATVINCKYFIGLDFTALKELCSMVSEFKKFSQRLLFLIKDGEICATIKKHLEHECLAIDGDEDIPLVCTGRKQLEIVIEKLLSLEQPTEWISNSQLQINSYIKVAEDDTPNTSGNESLPELKLIVNT